MKSLTPYGIGNGEQPRSQKAAGLRWLMGLQNSDEVPFVTAKDAVTATMDKTALGTRYAFVRACPVTPRHGILESRRVTNRCSSIIKATRQIGRAMLENGEPDGEIVIQPFIEATSNIVWFEGACIVGPGHDGVTAGHSPQITIPFGAPSILESAQAELGLENAEAEFVCDAKRVVCTQIRAANGHFKVEPRPVGAHPGFSLKPIHTKTADVLEVRGTEDLAKIEKWSTSNPEVLIVHYGGSIGSHAAAWARGKGYAFVALPETGVALPEWLYERSRGWMVSSDTEPGGEALPFEVEWFEDSFRKGLHRCMTSRLDARAALSAAIVAMNYASGVASSPESAEVSGYFAGALLRSCVAICLGEARHSYRQITSNWRNDNREAYNSIITALNDINIANGGERESVYTDIFSQSINPLQALRLAYAAHGTPKWAESFGGKKWANIAVAGYRLALAIEHEGLRSILDAMNALTNVVHNNGWAFNKLIDKSIFDLARSFYATRHWEKACSCLNKSLMLLISPDIPLAGEIVIQELPEWMQELDVAEQDPEEEESSEEEDEAAVTIEEEKPLDLADTEEKDACNGVPEWLKKKDNTWEYVESSAKSAKANPEDKYWSIGRSWLAFMAGYKTAFYHFFMDEVEAAIELHKNDMHIDIDALEINDATKAALKAAINPVAAIITSTPSAYEGVMMSAEIVKIIPGSEPDWASIAPDKPRVKETHVQEE
jgi:hypothetical protein